MSLTGMPFGAITLLVSLLMSKCVFVSTFYIETDNILSAKWGSVSKVIFWALAALVTRNMALTRSSFQ